MFVIDNLKCKVTNFSLYHVKVQPIFFYLFGEFYVELANPA